MKIYVASTLSNYLKVQYVISQLQSLGATITYDWTQFGEKYVMGEQIDYDVAEVAKKEASGVIECDHLLMLMPGGRGSHVELGLMIARCICASNGKILDNNMPITILLDPADEAVTSFHHLPGIFRTTILSAAINNAMSISIKDYMEDIYGQKCQQSGKCKEGDKPERATWWQ